MRKTETKVYRVTGWVQVSVALEIRARNEVELMRFLKKQKDIYGGLGHLDWNDGAWESGVTLDSDMIDITDKFTELGASCLPIVGV